MSRNLQYAFIVEQPRKVIHVVRVVGEPVGVADIDEFAERVRDRKLARTGDRAGDLVIVQGDTKETLRFYGEPYAISRVRAAMFNAAVSWNPLKID